jgi:signal transduction histidine kinase
LRRFFIHIIWLNLACFAQQKLVDSLNQQAFALMGSKDSVAYQLATSSLKLAKEENYFIGVADAKMQLGNFHLNRDEFVKAHRLYEEALEIRKQHDSERKIANTKTSIAQALANYTSLANTMQFDYTQRATDLLNEALVVYNKEGDNRDIIKTYIQLGKVNLVEQPAMAINWLNKAYQTALDEKSYTLAAKASQNIALYHFTQDNIDSIVHWSKISQRLNRSNELALTLNNFVNLGYGYYMQEKDDSALHYYQLAEVLALKDNQADDLLDIYKNLANYFAVTGEPQQANIYYDRALSLNDSLSNLSKYIQFANAQELYYTKELKAKSLVEREKRIKWTVAGIGALSLALVLGLFYRQRQKAIQSQLQLERQEFAQFIEKKEKSNLQAILNALEKERSRISKELHDKIGAGMSTVRLYFEAIEKQLETQDEAAKERLENVNTLLSNTVKDVRHLSQSLSTGILSDFGLETALLDLKETISKSGVLQFKLVYSIKQQQLSKNAQINIYRIVQEMVNNTIKHAEANMIVLNLFSDKQSIKLQYQDNGKGFDEKIIEKGLGLQHIEERIASLDGTYIREANTGKGTHYTITIPISELNTP